MSALAALRDLVEEDLDDGTNATWDTDAIDRAIQRALSDFSAALPRRVVGNLTFASAGREISMSTLTGLINVVRVWFPYTAADPEDPPVWARWEVWPEGTLRIISGDEPAKDEVARVYYEAAHTIEDLAGGASTTVAAEHEEVIVLGAGAYAAMQKARSAVGEAGVAGQTPEQWFNWAQSRMGAFRARLTAIRRREALLLDKRVPLDRDGWERDIVRGGI